MAVKLDENWQDGKTLAQCNLFLLTNEYSDVTFRLHYNCEVTDIPALRVMCLARSPVFYAMFTGELAQQPDNPIHDIHDDYANPLAFRQMLRFIYTDDLVLTADNVLSILYLSKKYMVSTLSKKCLKFLEKNLTADTAPLLLDQCILYEEKELKEKTLKTIQEEAPAVLASDGFLAISKEALGEMLSLNFKVEKGISVFYACMKWAKKQCEKLNKSPSAENIREVLGNNLYQIRFPLMSPLEFTEVVAPCGVLTGEEGYQVVRYILSKAHKPEKLPFRTVSRFQGSNLRTPMVQAPYKTLRFQLNYGTQTTVATSLSCVVLKPIRIQRVYTHSHGNKHAKHRITLSITQNGQCLHESTGQPLATTTGQLPARYAIDVNDIKVKSGAMELDIKLVISADMQGYQLYGDIGISSPDTLQLSDDYATITFPPVPQNLLLGIDYRIP